MSIKTVKLTPSIYSKESRDFQLISRLYDSVFNYSKMMVDNMIHEPLSNNSNNHFLDLAAKTLGFESKHNYNSNNLYALCSSFKKIMSYKGTKKAIEDTISLLMRAQNINKLFEVKLAENNIVKIFIPTHLVDTILLEDMMSYILPFGYVYEIYFRDISQAKDETEFGFASDAILITGDSAEFSRFPAYIGASLVTEKLKADEKADSMSGQEYIDTAKE